MPTTYDLTPAPPTAEARIVAALTDAQISADEFRALFARLMAAPRPGRLYASDAEDAAKARETFRDAAARLAKINPAADPLTRWLADHPADPLTAEAQADLANRARNERDRAARNDLALANLRLVYKITKNYAATERTRDLRQDALVELIEAAGSYDPGCGWRFTTIAGNKIRWRLARQRAAYRLISLPEDKARAETKIDREYDADYLARPAADRDLATELCWTPAALDRIRRLPKAAPWPTYGDPAEPGRPALDDLPAAEPDEADDRLERLLAALGPALARLTERQRRVVILWYGLDGIPDRSGADVAAALDLTEEQVYGAWKRAKAALRRELTEDAAPTRPARPRRRPATRRRARQPAPAVLAGVVAGERRSVYRARAA